MAFYSLPLEKYNVKVPLENCYLTLCKYGENHFKPQKDKKKLSADELKEKNKNLKQQQDTIKQLDSGYCNLYNCKFTLDTIYNSSFTTYLYDYDNYIIYKIKPLASNEVRNNYSYLTRVIYEVSEFDVVKKFANKEEVFQEMYNDRLLEDFSSQMFENLSYANEGYDIRLYDYFKYIKEKTLQSIKSSMVKDANDYAKQKVALGSGIIGDKDLFNLYYMLGVDLTPAEFRKAMDEAEKEQEE